MLFTTYDPNDALSPPGKTHHLARLALASHARGLASIQGGARFDELEIGGLRRAMAAFRSAAPEDAPARLRDVEAAVARLGESRES